METRDRASRQFLMAALLAAASLAASACDRPPTDPGDPTEGAQFGKSPPTPTAGIQVLPALNDLWAGPAAINDGEVIVGRSAYTESPKVLFHAVRWTRTSASADWQIEDLHPALPASEMSQANAVNESGVVVGYMETGGVGRGFVLTAAGDAIDLGPGVFAGALNDAGEMAGNAAAGYDGRDISVPLYWAAPGSDPSALPPLAAGASAEARFFAGSGAIIGVATDESGDWLVRWQRSGEGWTVQRLQPHTPRGPHPLAQNVLGMAVGNGCSPPPSCDPLADLRAWYWASFEEPALQLPTLANLRTFIGGIADDGLMVGTSHVKGLTSYRPVMWPSPTSIVELPLPPKGSSGSAAGVNGRLGASAGFSSWA